MILRRCLLVLFWISLAKELSPTIPSLEEKTPSQMEIVETEKVKSYELFMYSII